MDIKGFKSRDGSVHQYDYESLANKPDDTSVEDGGYYTPAVTQPDDETLQFDFTPSKVNMPAVDPVQVKLPVPDSTQNAPGVHIGDTPPEDTSLLWVDTSDETEDEDPLEGYYTSTETDAAIKSYVDTALGVIENGAY